MPAHTWGGGKDEREGELWDEISSVFCCLRKPRIPSENPASFIARFRRHRMPSGRDLEERASEEETRRLCLGRKQNTTTCCLSRLPCRLRYLHVLPFSRSPALTAAWLCGVRRVKFRLRLIASFAVVGSWRVIGAHYWLMGRFRRLGDYWRRLAPAHRDIRAPPSPRARHPRRDRQDPRPKTQDPRPLCSLRNRYE